MKALACAAAVAAAGVAVAADFTFYNIVPCIYGEEGRLADEMAEYHRRTGEGTVLYMLACAPEGKPATAKIDRHVASYRAFAAACRAADPELRVGILIQSALGHFSGDAVVKVREDWQRSIDNTGKPNRWCARDPDFRAYVKDFTRRLAAEKPCFIMTDDDIRNIRGDCFCPLHAAELNKRTGLARSAEEWRTAILASKPGSRDYDEYFRLQRETLEGLNALVREAIDEVDPTIPAAVCMGGEEYRFAGNHARAIAAKGQVPVLRISNSLYLEFQRGQYPFAEIVTRTQAHAATYEDEDVVLLDEADTWPQNLWSKSAISYHTHLVMGAMCGLRGAKVWYVNAHRHGNPIPRGYTDVMAAHKGYYGALARALEGMRPYGVITPSILKPSEWNAARPSVLGENFPRPEHTWAENMFCHFGVPVTATGHFERDGVWELAGADPVKRLADDELKAILSHRVIIDGKAAVALAKRGFADLIGADVSAESPAFNCECYAGTRISAGRLVKNDGAPTYALKPGARAFTELCFRSPTEEVTPVAPGTVVFRNALGGTVALTAYGYSAILYNLYGPERKRWVERTLAELNGGRFDYIVRNEQEVAALARETPDGRTAIVAAFNQGYDPLTELAIVLKDRPSKVERLSNDGTWVVVPVNHADGTLRLACDVPCQGEVVVRISR